MAENANHKLPLTAPAALLPQQARRRRAPITRTMMRGRLGHAAVDLRHNHRRHLRHSIAAECPSSGTHNVEAVKRFAQLLRKLASRLGSSICGGVREQR